MYTPLQLRFIEKFGDKTLTEGCYTLEKNGTMWHLGNGEWKVVSSKNGAWGFSSDYGDHMGKILGHEPHLFPDVARVMKEYGLGMQMFSDADIIEIYEGSRDNMIKDIPYNFTIPLLSQPEVMEQLLEIFKK